MLVRAKGNEIQLVCNDCGAAVSVKNGLTAIGFMRHFNAFRRQHDDQCKQSAKQDALVDSSIRETASLLNRITEGNVPENVRGTREDPYYCHARTIVLEEKRASASLVQRKLQIGYAHAKLLIESMEGDITEPPLCDGTRPILRQ